MDAQTRHALKQDRFVQATSSSVSWIDTHRATVIRWTIIVVLAIGIAIAGLISWNQKTGEADTALGAALDIYSSPLAQPGQPANPADKDTYPTAAARAKAANAKFEQVVKDYGWLPEGTKAHYFVGLTDRELGQTAAAESELKTAAGSANLEIANLAKLALAGLYHQTGRDGQAIELYNAIAAKPSDSVPAYTAQLALADLYVAAGKPDQARQLWAKVKDADKTGQAGSIAAQKLGGK